MNSYAKHDTVLESKMFDSNHQLVDDDQSDFLSTTMNINVLKTMNTQDAVTIPIKTKH